MIRVYSGNYVPTDYVIIENILSVGLKSVREIYCLGRCDSCPCERVCHSVQSAIHFCHKKAGMEEKNETRYAKS